MIVCHCNRIDHREIEAACAALVDEDPWSLLTPVRVYRALGHRPKCGGCLSLANSIIQGRDVQRPGDPACRDCPLQALTSECLARLPSASPVDAIVLCKETVVLNLALDDEAAMPIASTARSQAI